MKIRPATQDDNDALLSLCREAPMRGVLTVYMDRSPDFFKFTALQGDNPRVWVAEHDNEEIVGCIVQMKRTVIHRGKEITVTYGGDLKVHPKARGQKLGIKLSKHIIKQGYKDKSSIGHGTVIDGNIRAVSVINVAGKDLSATYAGDAYLYQLLPIKRFKVVPGYSIRNATRDDLPTIAEILKGTYKDHLMCPVFSEDYLLKETSKNSTFSIDSFMVAQKHDEIVACAAFWDQESIRRAVVLEMPLATLLTVRLLRAIGPIVGLPRIPMPGDSSRYMFLRFPGAKGGHANGLKAILHNEMNVVKSKKTHHFLWASFHQNDPLKKAVSEIIKMKIKVNVFYSRFSDDVILPPENELIETPSYLDFSLI